MAQHTKQAKEAIEQVFASLQQDADTSLETWARNNLDVFYTALFPRLLPVQMQHSGHMTHETYSVDAPPPASDADEWQTEAVRH